MYTFLLEADQKKIHCAAVFVITHTLLSFETVSSTNVNGYFMEVSNLNFVDGFDDAPTEMHVCSNFC